MRQLTQAQVDEVVDVVNGYEMTYGDYLDNTGVEYEVVG